MYRIEMQTKPMGTKQNILKKKNGQGASLRASADIKVSVCRYMRKGPLEKERNRQEYNI